MAHSKSLAEMFPDIASQWDYNRNGSVTPETISAGSHKEAYWICPICHQSYIKRICNRTSPSKRNNESDKCPICLGRVIIPGFNSLKTKYPDVVENEWDYDLNDVDPDTISAHTNKKYWWRCIHGHPSYLSTPNNKISNTGGNCPYCSHQKLSPENSLAIVNPKLAEEWCYELNALSPDKVFANANISVFWKCSKGHIWKAKINNRNLGKGCPECAKGHQSSFPEQAIFYYIKSVFPDALNGYKQGRYDMDIFIPSLKIGIEYDGEYYHSSQTKLIRDSRKTKALARMGISLIRVRELGCPAINDGSVVFRFKYTNDYSELNNIIPELMSYLAVESNKKIKIKVDIESIRKEISEQLSIVPLEKSLQNINPSLAKEWDYDKNAPLRPEQVYPSSSKKAFWKCPKCGYQWEAVIGSRNQGFGCPRCSNRENYTTEEWIRKAKEVQGNKYDYSKVKYESCKKFVTIICPKHGEFTQMPAEHLAGKGCKYCAHQTFHPLESLANIAPEIAAEWDYEMNKDSGYTPETISATNSTKQFYWHCNNGESHSYHATCASRVNRHTGCAVCHGKQTAYDMSVEYNYPELAKEWCDSNNLKPSEISCGSEKKIWWKCINPLHKPYLASVYNRVHLHSGCPECSGNIKSDMTYRQELAERFPYIELLSEYKKSSEKVKCKCLKCGYEWESYPFNLLKRKNGCPKCKI